jgi:hypothetical protein
VFDPAPRYQAQHGPPSSDRTAMIIACLLVCVALAALIVVSVIYGLAP